MTVRIINADVMEGLAQLADESVHCVVTSPPYYGLRDYGVAGQIGLEPTLAEYVEKMVAVFREVRRVLRDDGTLWLNIGDSYAANRGYQVPHGEIRGAEAARNAGDAGGRPMKAADLGFKVKDLMGVPWRVAFALQSDGWYLRSEIIWHKRSCMPESVTDRPTKSHEHIFLLAKSERYYYDAEAASEPAKDWSTGGPGEGIKETDHYGANNGGNGGLSALAARYKRGDQSAIRRNWRDVWSLGTESFKEAHFATFPTEIPRRAIVAGCPAGGTVLDPFGGAGTTGLVADRLQRDAILIELNPAYAAMARKRIAGDAPLLTEVA